MISSERTRDRASANALARDPDRRFACLHVDGSPAVVTLRSRGDGEPSRRLARFESPVNWSPLMQQDQRLRHSDWHGIMRGRIRHRKPREARSWQASCDGGTLLWTRSPLGELHDRRVCRRPLGHRQASHICSGLRNAAEVIDQDIGIQNDHRVHWRSRRQRTGSKPVSVGCERTGHWQPRS
jgi:hypothetical protein